MERIFIILIFMSFVLKTQAQDSLRTNAFDVHWTKSRLVPRVGVALQQSTAVEAGITYHKIFVHPLTLASTSKYLTAEVIVRDNIFVFGPKLGYEFTVGVIGIATDVTYYTDTHVNSFVFTPKGGLSILGFVNLFYGYNFSLSNESFGYISKNRFSISFNLNRDYSNLKNAPRK